MTEIKTKQGNSTFILVLIAAIILVLAAAGAIGYVVLADSSDEDTDAIQTEEQQEDEAEEDIVSEETVSDENVADETIEFNAFTCESTGSIFEKPVDWFTYEEFNTTWNGEACYLTREDISTGNIFDMGFTAIRITDISAKYNTVPSELSKDFIEEITKSDSIQNAGTVQEISKDGVVRGYYRFMIAAFDESDGSVFRGRQYYGIFHNDEQNALYLIIFEAPESEFDGAYDEIGKRMISNMRLGYR